MTRAAAAARQGTTWRVPLALVALTAFPLVAGVLRLVEVLGGPAVLPDNPRVAALPAPLVVHVVSVTVYAVVGAFQMPARLRRSHPVWHRRAGRVAVVAGAFVALSGLWMTLVYQGAPGGDLLRAVRLVVGSAVAVSIGLGVAAIRRRDVPSHRAWMIRAYALAVAAGTQTLTQGAGQALFGTGTLSTALSISAGWVVNAVVAEVVVRRPRRTPVRPARSAVRVGATR